jgi:hypothetical protein
MTLVGRSCILDEQQRFRPPGSHSRCVGEKYEAGRQS